LTAAAMSPASTDLKLDRPRRILIADDEHLVATDLSMTLGELGYTVLGPVADGEAAFEMAATLAPDLALLDIQMPHQDGLTVARRIFTELHIPVVVLSAYSDDEYIETAQGAGVFGYLIKPASANQLRAAIDIAWGRYQQAMTDRAQVAELQQKLEDRRTIEKAKWILVQRKQLNEEDALRMLQHKSRQSRKRIVEISQQIIDAADLL